MRARKGRSSRLLRSEIGVPSKRMLPATLAADTIRLEVGAKEINGRVYAPHAARVRVRVGGVAAPITAEWTNELTLGDSGGRPGMRWVT